MLDPEVLTPMKRSCPRSDGDSGVPGQSADEPAMTSGQIPAPAVPVKRDLARVKLVSESFALPY